MPIIEIVEQQEVCRNCNFIEQFGCELGNWSDLPGEDDTIPDKCEDFELFLID